jgi:hypothetical protein
MQLDASVHAAYAPAFQCGHGQLAAEQRIAAALRRDPVGQLRGQLLHAERDLRDAPAIGRGQGAERQPQHPGARQAHQCVGRRAGLELARGQHEQQRRAAVRGRLRQSRDQCPGQ